MLKLIFATLLLLMTACSSSHPSQELAGSDYGMETDGSNRANRFVLKRDDGTISSRYYSHGCHSLQPGASCELLVEYIGSAGMQGSSLGVQVLPKGAFRFSGIDACPKISPTKQTCVLTLTHNSGASALGSIRVYAQKPSRTIALINIQSSSQNQVSEEIGTSDLINIGTAVFGPVAGDEVEKLLGIQPNGEILNDLSELSAQVSAISSTVNQILNDVEQIENIDILEFSALEQSIQDNNLKTQLEALNQNTLGGAEVYAGFESAIISGTCPLNQAPQYLYPSAAQIASTPAYLSGVYQALGCDTTAQSTTCSSLNSALSDATNLAQGVGRFDQALFQAVNSLIQANLKAQFSIQQFQSNNESIVAYGTLIAQTLQKSYNMIHTALSLSQVSHSPQFPGLIIPIASPQMSPNFTYTQNKEALDQYFTDLGNQLQEDFYAAVMTDNPGDPTQLWPNNTSASLSPKLIASGLNAIPSGVASWVSTCNLYEWAGALTPEDYTPGSVQKICSATGMINSTVPNPPAVPVDYQGQLNATKLSANCYYQGRENDSSILWTQCQADASGAVATQANIHAALTGNPYLECDNLANVANALPSALGPSSVGSISGSVANSLAGSATIALNLQTIQGPYAQKILASEPIGTQGCQTVGGYYGNTGSVQVIPLQIELINGEMLKLALGYGVSGNVTNYQQVCARDICTQEAVGCNLTSYAVLQCLSSSQYTSASCSVQSNGSLLYTTNSGVQVSLALSSNGTSAFNVSVRLGNQAQCLLASDCSNGLVCAAFSNQCGCTDSSQCLDSDLAVCNTQANQCVQCLNSSDCRGSVPVCDTGANHCVACLQNSDCSGNSDTCTHQSCECGSLGGACGSTSCIAGQCACGDMTYGDGYCPANQSCEIFLVAARVEHRCR
ncbi:MAG: hypothetical protein I8H75_01155 [Myxococcaceae bacterium]|nr:hypothetical protein [Myxococcaceae bacterium]MBH2005949.1 hypothetical protein [Myxococcaceae bacterium]